uniref:Lathosterol oxidase-like n=1 Tax=Ciona intestinalis TaxID=7719 RepID=F6TVN3_CIOIN|nr:lathosterol oxidase-like [Ciona intestinalis]|eukprot:XP_002131054.1 lathosterol oxidase-like [Ciona intestinalis]
METVDLYAKKTGGSGWMFSSKTFIFVFSSILVAMFGAAARGEVIVFIVMLWKNWEDFRFIGGEVAGNTSRPVTQPTTEMSSLDKYLSQYHLQFVYFHIAVAFAVSYSIFIVVGGFLQWYFYIKRRDQPETWKCQPKRFLTAKNERHEILLGAFCLFWGSILSGLLVTYISNGGKGCKVYYDVTDYGWFYFVTTTIFNFMYQDAISYYYHRMLHYPFFYRNFHKWHHRYHSPTAFSAVAMHPVESIVFQLLLNVQVFIVPMHYVTVAGCQLYLYYFGLIDHSGIDMDSMWPWQPPVRFHDDHHKYFHVNFGFNTMLFDRYHDTIRHVNRKYAENIFGGKGAPSGEKELK